MTTVQERYHPQTMAVNSTFLFKGDQVAGFLAITTGTLTLTRVSDGLVIINAVPVTAGIYTPMPFFISTNGSGGYSITLAGGASGVVGY